MTNVFRSLRHAWCGWRHRHQLMAFTASPDHLMSRCEKCGHLAVISLVDLPKPKPYLGIAKRKRIA